MIDTADLAAGDRALRFVLDGRAVSAEGCVDSIRMPQQERRRGMECGLLAGQNGFMTTKEILRRMVEAMTDEDADRALRALEPLGVAAPEAAARRGAPSFVGSFASGDGSLSQRTDELLADGFAC
jgi:hypothetical protein